MTYIIYLFFISLIGIIIMFKRKLALVENGHIDIDHQDKKFEIPYALEIKHLTIKKIKRGGYILLVTSIRLYFRSLNLLKKKYYKIKVRISKVHKTEIESNLENKKINKFLKGISDYKNKIKRIKYDIKEEENKI